MFFLFLEIKIIFDKMISSPTRFPRTQEKAIRKKKNRRLRKFEVDKIWTGNSLFIVLNENKMQNYDVPDDDGGGGGRPYSRR